jgi:hypothetical protein
MFCVSTPTPGINAVINVDPTDPMLGVILASFGSNVIPAVIRSCPCGRPTGKKRLRSDEVKSETSIIVNIAIVSL